jgi:hypothetical protein
MKSNIFREHVPALVACALPFIGTSYNNLKPLDIVVMALAATAGIAIAVNMLMQRKKV